MSNPWKRAERYRHVAIERLDGWVHSWWVCAQERRLSGVGDLRLAASAALRLRAGARHACKRLREERDRARAHSLACDVAVTEAHAEATNLEEERDAAQLELRALEWLIVHHPDELRGLVLAAGDRANRYSYCARALGWEG